MVRTASPKELSYADSLSPFEKAKVVRDQMAHAASTAVVMRTWSDDFRLSQINDRNQVLVDMMRGIPLTGLSDDECSQLGFGRWSEESSIRLIPVYLYPHLRFGETLTSFSGREVVVGEDYANPESGEGYVDSDYRFGCLAFGVFPVSAEAA